VLYVVEPQHICRARVAKLGLPAQRDGSEVGKAAGLGLEAALVLNARYVGGVLGEERARLACGAGPNCLSPTLSSPVTDFARLPLNARLA